MKLISEHIAAIKSACKKHGVKSLYVFGSVVDDALHKESDIDFLVEFGDVSPDDYFDNFISFKSSLQKLLKRSIDLLEKQTLKNPVLIKSVNENKVLIYEREDSKVVI